MVISQQIREEGMIKIIPGVCPLVAIRLLLKIQIIKVSASANNECWTWSIKPSPLSKEEPLPVMTVWELP